ncbi:benzyl alcohol O-benzoyltransferase [Medicago truncatula]|uniref:Benzyl alcohol O-benzoyltransferase n=1 Tax=Medicago truncatula TaxID=3880 RepID=A0A072UFH8_MEDTR|nr:benzyl alcohol O-benzoyltransferase [Medicago truncatula]
MTSSSLMFTVRRCQPELVPPAAPTPREVKLLSDIDDQEGVMFIEAEADVTLDQFGDALHPPFPCFQQLLYDVPGSEHIIDRTI